MDTSDLPPPQGERHILAPEEELRLEVPFSRGTTCQLLLQKGSCELLGVELVTGKPVMIADDGGLKSAFFTWHGCVIDVECEHGEKIAYSSDETNSNVAIVNTHAQLEALRDEAAASGGEGPRVLIAGPVESGKTCLAKVLTAYATKLGRTPIAVDLDPADNGLSVPGSLAAVPMTREAVTPQSYATGGLPAGTASPLVMWHGSLQPQPDLFKAQVTALGQKIHARLQSDEWARSSGLIVNTNGWIEDEGYQLLLHTVQAFQITVVLVVGHDRLYSMMRNHLTGKPGGEADGGNGGSNGNGFNTGDAVKVIKVPRSGGVVSRDANFLRQSRSRSLKRYFYGDMVDAQPTAAAAAAAIATPTPNSGRVSQLTPFLLQLPFKQLTIYKFSSISLSASLLPVAAAQATEPVQFVTVSITDKLQHAVLAVCHPHAVASYEKSGRSADLYAAGVAGFCAVERVSAESETVDLLSPCAGSLPSNTLILGDITWME
jgi:polyribonucleotide 5'-hydroxyl-kinase